MSDARRPTATAQPEPLQAGREAFARHAWLEAFERLSEADRERPLGAMDLESLALAAFFAARADAELDIKERAFKAHEADGNLVRAAYLAIDIARTYGFRGKPSIASAWRRRAEQLIGADGDTYAHGYLALVGSEIAAGSGDLDAALAWPSGRSRSARPRRIRTSGRTPRRTWARSRSRPARRRRGSPSSRRHRSPPSTASSPRSRAVSPPAG
jgi:hypothetical protein